MIQIGLQGAGGRLGVAVVFDDDGMFQRSKSWAHLYQISSLTKKPITSFFKSKHSPAAESAAFIELLQRIKDPAQRRALFSMIRDIVKQPS